MQRVRPALLLLLAVAVVLGCAHAAKPRPGTGALAFRAVWSGKADVDLAVTSPREEHVAFGSKSVPSGGRLDVDCNYSSAQSKETAPGSPEQPLTSLPAIDQHLCARPMENVFWPRGQAPPGNYRVMLYVANPEPPPQAGDAYELLVIVRGEVRLRRAGRVADLVAAPLDLAVEVR